MRYKKLLLLKKKNNPTPAPPNPNPPGPTPPPNPNPPLIFPNVGPSDLQWQISSGTETFSNGPFYPNSEETDDEILFSSRTRKNKDRAKC